MSKSPITESQLGMPPAVITHTFIRLRGTQTGDLTVHHARTTDARISLLWSGIHMTFLNADAAQGLLESISAARASLINLTENLGSAPATDETVYARPTIAIEWTRGPKYGITPRSTIAPDLRRTVHWVEIYVGPITFQILDRAAFRSTLVLLREVHTTATAVCLDGNQHSADPTADDYEAIDTNAGLIARPSQ